MECLSLTTLKPFLSVVKRLRGICGGHCCMIKQLLFLAISIIYTTSYATASCENNKLTIFNAMSKHEFYVENISFKKIPKSLLTFFKKIFKKKIIMVPNIQEVIFSLACCHFEENMNFMSKISLFKRYQKVC